MDTFGSERNASALLVYASSLSKLSNLEKQRLLALLGSYVTLVLRLGDSFKNERYSEAGSDHLKTIVTIQPFPRNH